MYLLLCAAVFLAAYLLNIAWISVFYHRALAHHAIDLGPRMQRFVVATGPWITGMDPKAWVCMHRLHHVHSDTPRDPHSPANVGVFGVLTEQFRSYTHIQRGLLHNDPTVTRRVRDLDFDVPEWMYNPYTALLPYIVHAAIAVSFALVTNMWLLAAAFWLGMMSHPIQGWLVNAFAHAVGGRNFDTRDNSRNTWLLGLLIAGEGLQNNHHAFPASAKFSFRWWEVDPGWAMVNGLSLFGLVTVRQDKLIPTYRAWEQKIAARRRLKQDLWRAQDAAERLAVTLEPVPGALLDVAAESALAVIELSQELADDATAAVRRRLVS
jgi:stearoyl-CoA desaturase (Delta-9 desaturase)